MNRLTRYHALAFMVLCLLVAAMLRLPNLVSAPPGLHYDEAANGLLAAEIGIEGERPVFISSYTGKEVFFFYLAGGLMRLVGDSVFTLRLTAAFVGMLTVAATYWLGREMLADRRLAILACALLAVSFWHVLFSRLGFRAITQPLLQVLAVAGLFRGLRRDQNRWIIAGGVFLGLAAYTYLAARVFPILLLVALLPLLFNGATWRKRWAQIAIYLGVALIVLLPLLNYFWANPNAFWVRISQVAPDSGGLTIWQSLLKSWGMFFLQGDTFWRFNLPGRPLFSWLWGGLLVVGWVLLILRWRRYPYDWQRSAITLLIFTPLVMILPTALATNELVPSNLRAIGLMPFIYFLPAIGFVLLFYDLEKRIGFLSVTSAVIFVSLLLLLSGGLATAFTYFDHWAGETTLFYESDGDLTAVSAYLDEADGEGKSIYVAAPHYRHPTVAFLSEQYDSLKWLPGSQALVIPEEEPALIIYPHNSPAPDWALPYLAQGSEAHPVPENMPADAFTVYEIDGAGLEVAIPHTAGTDFAGVITLLGYELDIPEAGGDLGVTLFWHVDQETGGDFLPFVQLEDAWGHRWSQEESFAYPAEQWTPGETIIQHVAVPLPPGIPPGSYRLRIGLFDPVTGDQLPRLDEQGNHAGNAFFLEDILLPAAGMPDRLPQPPHELLETVVPGLQLLGYEHGGHTVSPGAPYGLSFWWWAGQELPDLSMFINLVNENMAIYPLVRTMPVHGTYSFADWDPTSFIIDHQLFNMPLDLAPGAYQIQLEVQDSAGQTVYIADLGPLGVEKDNRLFEAPAYEEAVGVTFGSEIELLGYDLSPVLGQQAELSLIWQAQDRPSADYTVFVHVLNRDGTCCLWQQDTMPGQGAAPTSLWLADEVIVDPYLIILPEGTAPGEYPIEVGLYVAETGKRLAVEGSETDAKDAVFLKPLVVPE